MKTATQSGWYLAGDDEFITLYNERGDYMEVTRFFDNVGWYSPNGFDWQDLPISVLNLISLWIGVKI
jgi:hypothetical protein